MSNNTLTPVGDQSTAASPNPNPAVKRRRNLPGNPAPDAEVIALSPTSLMATNRFVCEVCNKGFQREQNLQLHRRGHNLPWKLNKRTAVVISGTNNDEEVEMVVVRKKVYVCPEEGCVHHQASRALGDLTGIKKHFSRKHGEKKFKCEKCSKKYAVHSDWKAHSKTCGTKEYKCDCGTIFSRRDSFVTHRAFCDALAEESSKTITNPNHNINLFTPPSQPSPSLNSNSTNPIISHDIHQQLSTKTDQNNFNYMRILQTQPWTNSSLRNNIMLSPLPFSFPSSLLPSSSSSSSSSSSHLSATALLQKAAEVGATMSTGVPSVSQMATHHHSSTSSSSPSLLQEMMMMMSSSTTSSSLSVTPGFSNDNNNNELEVFKIDQGLTRDFLGLNALSHADIFTMARSLHYDQISSERDEKR